MPSKNQRFARSMVRKHGRLRPPRNKVGGRVTKKGAYRGAQKRNFMRKRAAVVETKRKDHEDLRSVGYFSGTGNNPVQDHMAFTAYSTEHIHMNPLTYYLWSQGLGQSQHIGQSVTVKHLNQKIQVRFPQPSMAAGDPQKVPFLPQKYELVWGWIPAPLQLTGATTPAANNVSTDQIKAHTNLRVVDYFNSRKDRLRFIPKKDSSIRISGRRIVRPDLRYTSTAPPTAVPGTVGADTVIGTIPDYFTEISWKMPNGGKKLHLEQTGNLDNNPDPTKGALIGMYPNYSWMPFCVLVNWNYDELLTAHPNNTILYCPSVAWNDIVYFTDS